MMRHLLCGTAAAWLVLASHVAAGAQPWQPFAGAVAGISTLSADARSITGSSGAEVSLYKPENGPAIDLLAGAHLGRFISVQANYIWNRNDLAVFASRIEPGGAIFHEQQRESTHHAVVADLLLYFRERGSGIRPYLSAGVGIARLDSHSVSDGPTLGIAPAVGPFSRSGPVLRVAVGIDLAVARRWSVRYTFSETIGHNAISASLTPPGTRNLANFQNLFGLLVYP